MFPCRGRRGGYWQQEAHQYVSDPLFNWATCVNDLFTNCVAPRLDSRVELRRPLPQRSWLLSSAGFAQVSAMNRQSLASDTFALSGDEVNRLRQALNIVIDQA